jgi:hypothetical protein
VFKGHGGDWTTAGYAPNGAEEAPYPAYIGASAEKLGDYDACVERIVLDAYGRHSAAGHWWEEGDLVAIADWRVWSCEDLVHGSTDQPRLSEGARACFVARFEEGSEIGEVCNTWWDRDRFSVAFHAFLYPGKVEQIQHGISGMVPSGSCRSDL